MENLVVLKRDDLEVLLKQIAANMKAEATAEPARKLKMNIDEALIYLNEQGYLFQNQQCTNTQWQAPYHLAGLGSEKSSLT